MLKRQQETRSSPPVDDEFLGQNLVLGFQHPGTPHLHNGDDNPNQEKRRPGGQRGALRGPRKAAEPTGDIKLRLGQATEAYVNCDYEEAVAIIREIIRINAETLEAWTIFSAVHEDLGDIRSAVHCKVTGAMLRPKDVQGWIKVADFALEQTGEEDRNFFLDIAFYAYCSAIRANVECIEGRMGKAEIKLERGSLAGAISDFKKVFKYAPHHLHAVRRLGLAYFEKGEIGNAQLLYKETFDYLRLPSTTVEETFDWTDVSVYIALLQNLGEFRLAISELKSLSRWLLGREAETFFDSVTTNDCEWDMDDLRRKDLADYKVEKFPSEYYGAGLPPELRGKIALCRVKLVEEEEASVSTAIVPSLSH